MGDNEYKISLGIQLDTSDLQTQINKAGNIAKPIKLDVEFGDINKDIKAIKSQLDGLGKKNTLSINTQSLENSLSEVSASIKEIKTLLSTVDGKSGMNSLLSTVDKISTALNEVSAQFKTLDASLSSLANKDFNINFGLNTGNNNPVKAMSDYGREARKNAIPALQEQVQYLQKLIGGYDEAQKAVARYLLKTKQGAGLDSFTALVGNMDGMSSDGKKVSLTAQMDAYVEYIKYMKQIASSKGIDLSGFNAKFSKAADDIVADTVKIQNGTQQTEDAFKKLERAFGSGISSEALDGIVKDLNDIRNAIVGLPDDAASGLANHFKILNETLEKLLSNVTLVKGKIDSVGSGSGSGVSNVNQQFKAVEVEINDTENQVTELQAALQSFGLSESSINAISKEFDRLGTTAKKVTVDLQNDIPVKITVSGVDELKDAVKVMAKLDDEGNIDGGINRTSSKSINDYTAELKELEKTANKIKNLKINIGKLDANSNINEINVLEKQLAELEHTYQDLKSKLSGKIPDGQLDPLTADAKEVENALNHLEAQLADTRAKLAKKIEFQLETGKFTTQVQKVENDVKRLSKTVPELKVYFDNLKTAEASMNTAFESGSIDEQIDAYNKYKATLELTENQIRQVKIAQDELNREQQEAANVQKLNRYKESLSLTMSNWLKDNSKAANMFGKDIENLQVRLQSCNNIKIAKGIGEDFIIVTKRAKEAGVATKTFGDSLREQWDRYKSYLSVASVIMYATQAMRSMFEQVKAIDSAMTELKKVTDETDASYSKFMNNAADRAKAIGTTIDGLVSSTADFARLGYSFEDSQGLAEVANIYAVVGDEIDSVEDATKSLISTMAAFKGEADGLSNSDFALSVVDKMNEVSNNFAISSGGLGEALERSASSLYAANNTLDESIALITAANTVVQDPTQVGKRLADFKSGYIG